MLAANASSLPEVGGALCEYVEPWDVDAWAERISHYYSHRDELSRRETAIRLEYSAITWGDTVRGVLKELDAGVAGGDRALV